jgi:hypothetical protein
VTARVVFTCDRRGVELDVAVPHAPLDLAEAIRIARHAGWTTVL